LIDACIDALRNRKFNILPDFATGGQADFSGYNEGLRGGKIRVRARIAQLDKKTLVINEIPFGTTTASLIDSIIAANDKEKIKVRKVEDNTADKVEILIHLAPGVSPDITIDALYKFTDCEVSISPNSCVIEDDKPRFLSVNEILKESAHRTMELLRTELEIRQRELQEAWHFSSLEKIFIEKRIYRNIEECETWEAVLETIAKGLQPYRKLFKRDIIQDDIVKLTEIKIKRISKFDAFKADEEIKGLEAQLKEVGNHIENIVDYSVEYFRNLKKKYGKGKERKTEIRTFDSIVATRVVMANEKLYINRAEGFAGYALKKDEYVCDCSDIDDIVVFRDDGTMTVTRISEKAFVGKGVIHIAVFRKDDERTVYHLVYQDGPRGKVFVKRFTAGGVTRDKAYDLTRGTKGSKILYFTANPNGESEVISVELKPLPNLRKLLFDIDLAGIEIKGRSAVGITVTKFPVKRVIQKSKGFSTLGARSIWFDEIVKRLNADGRGKYLGEFSGEDRIIVLTQSGHYRLYGFDLSTHFEDDLIHIEKFNPERVVSAIYYDGDRKEYFIKRFIPELSEKKTLFITEADGSKLEVATMHQQAQVEIIYTKQKGREIPNEKIKLHEYADVKSLKAKGSRYTGERIKEIMLLSKEQGPAAPEPQKKEAPEPKASKTPKKPDPRALTFEDERKERLKEIRSHLDAMEIQTKLDLE